MSIVSVNNLPIAANVCEQVLREMERQPGWSLAHVLMNPLASSLLHLHRRMVEIYVVTRGYGMLTMGNTRQAVTAGSVIEIPVGTPHMLRNLGAGSLEHLVFALPPFDPTDIEMVDRTAVTGEAPSPLLPPVKDCFDGAKILPYDFPHLDLSVAFGWVIDDQTRRKEPHYHEKTTEWIYVVEGAGTVELDDACASIEQGDWITVRPGVAHALRNYKSEDMVVACVCSPAFNMSDVHYRR